MRIPAESHLEGLLRWQPPGGVVSVYVDLRPEDWGEPWRIELRNGLSEARKAADDPSERALAATAERIEERLNAEREAPSGRTRIGFVEASERPGREEWFAVQARLAETEVAYAARPVIGPLVALLDGHAPRGVAAVSAERIRLMRWSLAGIEELEAWGLEIFSLDWRERKAQRSSDPAQMQGTKASGHDQFEQRLEANRERFLHEAGRLAASELKRRGCTELLAFGEPEHVRALAEGAAGTELGVRAVAPKDLISEPLDGILARVSEHLLQLQRERELALVDRVRAEADADGRGAFGAKATSRALVEGRVEHLLLAPELAAEAESMVEAALETSARVTQVHAEDATEALADADGVAALLRY